MNQPVVSTAMDPLGAALHLLRMSGVFYCASEFSAPWGLALPPMRHCLMFHFVTAGRCLLDVKGSAIRELRPAVTKWNIRQWRIGGSASPHGAENSDAQ